MEEKRTIKIRLSLVLIIIVILILLVAGMLIYISKTTDLKSNTESNFTNNIKKELANFDKENITNDEIGEMDNSQTNEIKGEKFIQFDTEFYELKDIAKEYRNCENIKNYKDFEYDLDGDGIKDKITTKPDKSEEGKYVFELNGKEFAAHYNNPEIYIVDLNEKDTNIEVVIFDNGPSDDPNYTIYSKQNSEMKSTNLNIRIFIKV